MWKQDYSSLAAVFGLLLLILSFGVVLMGQTMLSLALLAAGSLMVTFGIYDGNHFSIFD